MDAECMNDAIVNESDRASATYDDDTNRSGKGDSYNLYWTEARDPNEC